MKNWLFLIFAISTIAWARDEKGNGMDHTSFPRAWFVGRDKVVLYCIDRSPDFTMHESAAESAIDTAFKKWREYLTQFARSKERLQPSTSSRLLNHCNGTEDLKFYLGTFNSDVERARKEHNDPYSLAQPLAYDLEKGWGRGFIWVKNQEWNEISFFRVMMHEIGHVLGNGHINNTVMDSVYEAVISGFGAEASAVDIIESAAELISSEGRPFKNQGRLNVDQTQINPFKTFVGRDPIGKIRATFESSPTDGNVVRLTLTDDKGSKNFDFFLNLSSVLYKNQDNLFRVELKNGSTQEYSSGQVYHSTIRAFDGKSYLAVIDRNTGGGLPVEGDAALFAIRLIDANTGIVTPFYLSRSAYDYERNPSDKP